MSSGPQNPDRFFGDDNERSGLLELTARWFQTQQVSDTWVMNGFGLFHGTVRVIKGTSILGTDNNRVIILG